MIFISLLTRFVQLFCIKQIPIVIVGSIFYHIQFKSSLVYLAMEKKVKLFLLKNKENGDYNQYWYSDKTILFLANQAIKS